MERAGGSASASGGPAGPSCAWSAYMDEQVDSLRDTGLLRTLHPVVATQSPVEALVAADVLEAWLKQAGGGSILATGETKQSEITAPARGGPGLFSSSYIAGAAAVDALAEEGGGRRHRDSGASTSGRGDGRDGSRGPLRPSTTQGGGGAADRWGAAARGGVVTEWGCAARGGGVVAEWGGRSGSTGGDGGARAGLHRLLLFSGAWRPPDACMPAHTRDRGSYMQTVQIFPVLAYASERRHVRLLLRVPVRHRRGASDIAPLPKRTHNPDTIPHRERMYNSIHRA